MSVQSDQITVNEIKYGEVAVLVLYDGNHSVRDCNIDVPMVSAIPETLFEERDDPAEYWPFLDRPNTDRG